MREIKFRAWDGERMLYQKDFAWLLLGDSGYQAFCQNLDGEEEYTNSLESKEWSLMQFTRLKDANGVEIYEGDIVKTDIGIHKLPESMSIQEVVFKNGAFCLGRSGVYFWDYAHGDTDDTVEVIGNIHEHKSLLEANQ